MADDMQGPDAERERLQRLARYAEDWNRHPSLQYFGARVAFPDTSRVTVLVHPVPISMRGGFGDDRVVNGGILSALCDLLIGCTTGLVDPEGRAATVQLSIRLEQPLLGERIVGEARVDRSTGRLIFATAELSDEAGKICVRCQGIVSRMRAGARAE
jgi:acyl-coenzyme A thioesterase PaaI-like protein